MIKAEYKDKPLVIDILSQSFNDNKSVNYIIPQNANRHIHLANLISFSFDYCNMFGEVLLSDDKKACALIIYTEKKRTSIKSILLNIKLVYSCIGFGNLGKVLKREAVIKKQHPVKPFIYLWYIGVQKNEQHKGIGTQMLEEVTALAQNRKQPIYLETSTVENISWYEKHGFKIYRELNFGYKLYCMKLE